MLQDENSNMLEVAQRERERERERERGRESVEQRNAPDAIGQ